MKTTLMQRFLLIFVGCLWLLIGASLQPARAMQLSNNGNTNYVITLAGDAIPAEQTAALQLQQYLLEITGAKFDIRPEKEVSAEAPQILVGAGTRVKVLLPQQDWNALGTDGIVIQTQGNKLILAGGRPRGTLYAVFQFLEDAAGCRWWTATEKSIPRKSTFNISPQKVVYAPPFRYREHFTHEVQADPIFATVMRENGHFQKQSDAWGNHYNMLGFVHTFSKLLPPEKYFSQHPEWYSDPDNGNKPATAASKMPAAQKTQLCLSNSAAREELTKQALAWIAKNPDAGYISISQNDNHNYCQDPASMELAEQEGSQAAPLLDFVNKVAEKIHQHYPHFKVETLAYYYSEKPPQTIRPGKNAIIRLAPLTADFGHPLDSEWNQQTRDNLAGWAKIAPDLFVWNYVTNFTYTLFPHPNWAGLAEDLRFFAAHHVKGIFEQGDNYSDGAGDFVQLRTWLIGKLMWNPALDQQQLIDEFLRGYYGAAAPYLKEYLQLMETSYLTQNRKLSASNAQFSFVTLEVANRATQLFQEAANAVQGEKVLSERLRRSRLSLDVAILYRYRGLVQSAAAAGVEFLGPRDPNAAMQDYIATAQRFGVRNWGEGMPFAGQINRLQNMFPPPVPVPEFARKHASSDVIDVQQGQFTLFPHKQWSEVVADAAASDGKAAAMPGSIVEWAIQVKWGQFLDGGSKSKWHVYALARVNASKTSKPAGAAFAAGIYDTIAAQRISNTYVTASGLQSNQYQVVDLGEQQLNAGMYLYFAPVKNTAISRIYIDRIILIRAP